MDVTAIIAGTGRLPVEACKSLKAKNVSFFVVSLFPEDNLLELERIGAEVVKRDFYKPSEILKILQSKQSKKVLLIGKVDKRNLLKKLKLDWMAIKFLASTFSKDDKSLMENMLKVFEEHNIEVIKQSDVLDSLFVPPGVLTGTISEGIEKDVSLGMKVVDNISRSNIGQTVVMKDAMIIAVEAIEGTDKCIRRGIELGKGGVVICKGARVDQNKRYDLPTLGPDTLKGFNKGEVAAIAWQSSRTLIAEKDQFISKANELGITLISV